jgi:predicted DsbA family dithiol-disulfide isomerase
VGPLVVPVHYDFASAICHVAHRVTARMAGTLEELGVELRWTPVDLARLTGWRRGEPVAGPRRANALRVAAELGVTLRMPAAWGDSRGAGAVAILLEETPREAVWRERVFSACFEAGRPLGEPGLLADLSAGLGADLADDALAEARAELERRTERAAAADVAGVPTFVLGGWPLGGIQDEHTMRHLLARYAQRARAKSLA